MNTESGVADRNYSESPDVKTNDSNNVGSSANGNANTANGKSSKPAKHVTKLSTSSPEAIKVAAEITPTRLANLLIKKGPLPIRLITAQLAVEVPGFDLLSLSKQRRLIMAAMEAGDTENNVVFEKIGWGQWAVRRKDSDYIVTEGSVDGSDKTRVSVHELKEKAKLGWLKKGASGSSSRGGGGGGRRDSISNGKHNLHNVQVPGEHLDRAVESDEDDEDEEDMDSLSSDEDELHKLRMARLGHVEVDDNAIAEDSDEDDDEDDMDTTEDGVFMFDQDAPGAGAGAGAGVGVGAGGGVRRWKKKLPPISFAKRVPLKVLPPPHVGSNRRKLSLSAGGANSVQKTPYTGYTTRHQLFSRLRLNSIENLDNYIVSSGRGLAVLVSSPPPAPSASVLSVSPIGSWLASNGHLHPGTFNVSPDNLASTIGGRRKLSFNELSVRSTLLLSLPQNGKHPLKQEASDTDEEDWATIGAESLRKHSQGSLSPGKNDELCSDEKRAARALVDLMSI